MISELPDPPEEPAADSQTDEFGLLPVRSQRERDEADQHQREAISCLLIVKVVVAGCFLLGILVWGIVESIAAGRLWFVAVMLVLIAVLMLIPSQVTTAEDAEDIDQKFTDNGPPDAGKFP